MRSTFWNMLVVMGLAVVLLMLSGCKANRAYRAGRPLRSMDPEKVIDGIEKHFKIEELVDQYYGKTDGARRPQKEVRNEIIDLSMILMDQHYALFLAEFSAFRKGFDSTMDIGSMATDAVATIVSPAMTKSILSAISAGLTASKITIDKNYFYDQTIQVLIKQMEAQRKTAVIPLIENSAKSVEEYPLSAALADLERYYFAGTIDGALAGVQQNASRQETEAEQSLAKVRENLDRTIKYLDAALLWARANGVQSARNKLVVWYGSLVQDPIGNAGEIAAAGAVAAEIARSYQGMDDATFKAFFPVGIDSADESEWVRFDIAAYFKNTVTADAAAHFAAAFEDEDIFGLSKGH